MLRYLYIACLVAIMYSLPVNIMTLVLTTEVLKLYSLQTVFHIRYGESQSCYGTNRLYRKDSNLRRVAYQKSGGLVYILQDFLCMKYSNSF